MKLERCIQGTPEEMAAARDAVNKALGYPRRGVHVGGGIHCAMPDEWDGTGPTPPGWTKSATEPVLSEDGKSAFLPITGHEMDLIRPETLSKLSAPERSLLGKVGQAELVDVKAVVAAREAKAEQAQAEVKNTTADWVGAGIAAAVVVAEVVSRFV